MLVTKLKNSKWLVGIISIIIIGMISGWLYSNYSKMGEMAKREQGSVVDTQQFYQRLIQANYVLYYELLEQGNGDETVNLEDLYHLTVDNLDYLYEINNYGNEYEYAVTDREVDFYSLTNDEKYQFMTDYLNSIVRSRLNTARDSFNNEFKNFEYLAIMEQGDSSIQVGNSNLDMLLNDNLTAQQLDDLQNKYQYYVVINYDVTGKLRVSNVYGLTDRAYALTGHEKSTPERMIVTNNLSSGFFTNFDGFELSPIKNMTFIYGIPKVLVYNDYISQRINDFEWWSIGSVVGNYSWIAVALVAITAIILPFKAFKNSKLLKWLFKLPLEIAILLSCCLIPIFIEGMPSIVKHTLEDDLLSESFYLMFPANIHKYIDPTINIIMWMALLACILMVCLYVKNLFKTGAKGKFITINCVRWCWRKTKAAYRTLTDIDLKSANTKKLALFMGIQFVIISILCLTWFIGPFIAIVYVGFLFFYLNKKLKKVESNYSKLFVVTNELAEGNLDVQVDEDLGMFNSFKEEVVNIQSGFKKAVQNEVKSQRMKTDLIANVSHDLKTPLTSIITYVDLLKDENLNQEKRVQYLETLDQKSQRLKVLIEDLFEMSKASSGNISMNLQMVDVVSLMKQTLLETEDKTEASGLVIRRQFPEHKVMLSLDSERTFRVFENLISNMSKYAMSGTRAYIDILDNEDTVQIMFRNMSADEITVNVDELVERFVRGDQSRHTEGSGLGLAIAKSFVELQGGNFEVLIDGDLFKVVISFNK